MYSIKAFTDYKFFSSAESRNFSHITALILIEMLELSKYLDKSDRDEDGKKCDISAKEAGKMEPALSNDSDIVACTSNGSATGSIVVHSDKAAVFESDNVDLLMLKPKKYRFKLLLSCFGLKYCK